jgi:hypothetical protein
MENSTGGSMGQKGSLKGSGGTMQNGTMHNGASGNKMQRTKCRAAAPNNR